MLYIEMMYMNYCKDPPPFVNPMMSCRLSNIVFPGFSTINTWGRIII